jgi:hypothetical protein
VKYADRPLRLVTRGRFVSEPEPGPLMPRPHDFIVVSLVVVRHSGERRELDPRAWPEYGWRR